MKMRNSHGKKPAAREDVRRASRAEAINLPRLFLFLEVFVEKDLPGRSAK
jgi:hypothetical protein